MRPREEDGALRELSSLAKKFSFACHRLYSDQGEGPLCGNRDAEGSAGTNVGIPKASLFSVAMRLCKLPTPHHILLGNLSVLSVGSPCLEHWREEGSNS